MLSIQLAASQGDATVCGSVAITHFEALELIMHVLPACLGADRARPNQQQIYRSRPTRLGTTDCKLSSAITNALAMAQARHSDSATQSATDCPSFSHVPRSHKGTKAV
jgi:hypothetical protein